MVSPGVIEGHSAGTTLKVVGSTLPEMGIALWLGLRQSDQPSAGP